MNARFNFLLSFPAMLFLITGCASLSPTYINDNGSAEENANKTAFNPVYFKLEDGFKTSPPQCIAIMPLKDVTGQMSQKQPHVVHNPLGQASKTHQTAINNHNLIELDDEMLEQMRWNLYSHLAPHSYRDVELDKVNEVVADLGSESSNYPAIALALKCDALLIGEVIDYSSNHLGFYSQASIGVQMKLVRAKSNELLWEGNHVAKSQAGSVPLSPIGIVMGIYSAMENMTPEQMVHVEDDLFRRLLSTWDGDAKDSLQQDGSEHIQVAAHSLEQNEVVKDDNDTYSIVVENLYLRSGPGTRFTAETVLDQQDKLAIMNHEYAPWVQVKVNDGQLGYVNKKYIKAVAQPQNNELLAALTK